MRWFNTAGSVKPAKHYCIPPLERVDLDEVLGLVRDEHYFVLHARRQTGRKSALLALAEVLNRRGYRRVYVTFETARTAPDDVQRAMRTVLATLAAQPRATLDDGFLDDIWPDVLARVEFTRTRVSRTRTEELPWLDHHPAGTALCPSGPVSSNSGSRRVIVAPPLRASSGPPSRETSRPSARWWPPAPTWCGWTGRRTTSTPSCTTRCATGTWRARASSWRPARTPTRASTRTATPPRR